MEPPMVYWQFMLDLLALIIPIMPTIMLFGFGTHFFKRHDWRQDFFKDQWGALSIISFLLGIIAFLVFAYLPSRH